MLMKRVAFAAAAFWAAGHALGQAFTYQGELTSVGQRVSGPHDFEFRLFNAPMAGDQLGVTTSVNAAAVDEGRFTAVIDAGTGLFTGADIWLDISVRPAGVGGFTVLAPRQKLTPAPYATRALAEWLQPIGSATLAVDPARSRLLLNRTSRLNTSEFFGITAPVPDFSFGGMYVNVPGSNSLPFYGYSAGDGVKTCRTYYSGLTQEWVVSNNGDRLRVQSDGNVGIGVAVASARLDVGGAVRADAFTYSAPAVRTLSIPGAAFRAADSLQQQISEVAASGTYLAAAVGSGAMVAPLQLPDGATLQGVTLWVVDNSSTSSLSFRVYRRPHGQFGSVQVAVSGNSVTGGVIQTITAPTGLVIDNAANSYYIQVECGDWGGSTTSVFSGTATYTQAGPG